MRCLLIGNYGVGNLGDELLKEYFLRHFSQIDWKVLSARPARGELSRLPGGLRSLLGLRWIRTLRELRQADAVVFGGGSLFTDSESVYACALWWLHARIARLLRRKVFFAFQGVGPFRTKIGEWFARSAFRGAAFISVRDSISADRARPWRLNTEIIQSFDPVFSLMAEEISNVRSMDVSKELLVVIPRGNARPAIRHAGRLRIVSLQPDSAAERKISAMMTAQHPLSEVRGVRSLEQLLEALHDASKVQSHRYHGSLAALALGKELVTVHQEAGDKHDALSQVQGRSAQELLQRVKVGEEALRQALGSLSLAR